MAVIVTVEWGATYIHEGFLSFFLPHKDLKTGSDLDSEYAKDINMTLFFFYKNRLLQNILCQPIFNESGKRACVFFVVFFMVSKSCPLV